MEEEEEEFDYSYISRVNISDPICQLCGYHLQLTSCTSEMKGMLRAWREMRKIERNSPSDGILSTFRVRNRHGTMYRTA